MVGVANIAAHGQSQQLAHEVILQPGADNLPLVVQIFGTNKSDDAVHQKRIKRPRHRVGARFERQLIHSMMGLG